MAYVPYTVKAGDTVARIAAQYGVTVLAVAKVNGLSNANRLMVNQVLQIPVYSDDGSASYGAGGWTPVTPAQKANAAALAANAAAAPEAAKRKAVEESPWLPYVGIGIVVVLLLGSSRRG